MQRIFEEKCEVLIVLCARRTSICVFESAYLRVCSDAIFFLFTGFYGTKSETVRIAIDILGRSMDCHGTRGISERKNASERWKEVEIVGGG